jgi:hypothetical protein
MLNVGLGLKDFLCFVTQLLNLMLWNWFEILEQVDLFVENGDIVYAQLE